VFQILLVLCETKIVIRTKAIRCLTKIIESDPSILARVIININSKKCTVLVLFRTQKKESFLLFVEYTLDLFPLDSLGVR